MNLRFEGSYSRRRLNTVCLLRKPGKRPAPAARRELFPQTAEHRLFAPQTGKMSRARESQPQILKESAKAGTCVPASHSECSLKTEQIGRIAINEADAMKRIRRLLRRRFKPSVY